MPQHTSNQTQLTTQVESTVHPQVEHLYPQSSHKGLR